MTARDVCREARAWRRVDPESVERHVGLSRNESVAAIRTLAAEGYLERIPGGDDSGYRVTGQGISLALASAAKPVRRAHADRAVADLVGRALAINADPAMLFYVTRMRVFGSYLGDAERLGDVDVAFEIERRPEVTAMGSDAAMEVESAHIRASGRRFGNIVEEVYWPKTEVRLALKAKKRTISLMQGDQPEVLGVQSRVIFSADMGPVATYAGPGLAAVRPRRAALR